MKDQLFTLLRLALGTSAETIDLSALTKADWKALMDLSFEQGVSAIAVDGLQKNLELRAEYIGSTGSPTENEELALDSPELEDLKYEWFGSVFRTEGDFCNILHAAKSLAGKFPIVVLKGLSIARKYPIPAHRESADLDVYINENDGSTGSPTDDNLLLKGMEVIRDDYKHTGFLFQGVMVEYHKSLIAWKSLKNGRYIEKALREALKGEGSEVRGEGIFANDYFNALFVAVHSYIHFMLEEGLSLKHVIDWFLLCKELRGWGLELRERVSKTLEAFGMREFVESMTRVAEYVCKGASTELTKIDQRMLDDILSRGRKKRFKNGHVDMAYNILFRNGWKFRAFARESNWACLFRCGWNALF